MWGIYFLMQEIGPGVPERLGQLQRIERRWDRLTRQERRVARIVMRGLTNRQISVLLNVSRSTVHTHLVSIFSKLEVTTRTRLTADLYRIGIDPEKMGDEGGGRVSPEENKNEFA